MAARTDGHSVGVMMTHVTMRRVLVRRLRAPVSFVSPELPLEADVFSTVTRRRMTVNDDSSLCDDKTHQRHSDHPREY